MAEFELERQMPAAADRVFAIVSDLDRLDEWLPEAVRVQPRGAGTLHADIPPRGTSGEGLVRVRVEQRRVEWGSEDSPDYAGWLQVMHAGDDESSVLLHLSFLGDQPETHGGHAPDEVRRWLDEALTRLRRLVEQSG
jgi:hypothetical protein